MAVLKATCTTREHNSREKTGDDPKLKLDCGKLKLDCGKLKLDCENYKWTVKN